MQEDSTVRGVCRDAVKPLVLVHPVFCIVGAKLYHDHTCAIGESVWWEQQHFLFKLEVKDRCAYRKQQAKRGCLERLCEQVGLPSSAAAREKKMGDTPCLQTPLLLAWLLPFLLHTKYSDVGEDRATHAKQLLENFGRMAQHEIASSFVRQPLAVKNARGNIVAELPFRGSSAVSLDRHLINLYPEVLDKWEQAKESSARQWAFPALENAQLIDLLVFGAISSTRLRSCKALEAVLVSIKLQALERLSAAIEIYLLLFYVPTLTGAEQIQQLHTKSGKRVKLDDWTKAGALWRCRQAFGSSTTFLVGALQDKHMDAAFSRATCNVYFNKVEKRFANGCKRLSLNFDPGTYSGHSYNVGLAWCIDLDLATVLPVKVPAPQKYVRALLLRLLSLACLACAACLAGLACLAR